MVLFAAAALFYFARSLERPSPASLALWALASALALSSHYFAAFLIVPQALWLLLRGQSRGKPCSPPRRSLPSGWPSYRSRPTRRRGGRRNGFTETPLASRVGETALNLVSSEEPPPFAGNTKTDAVQLVASRSEGRFCSPPRLP